eukprot:5632-Eustigmatos_ZCMA.PRE.1
MTRLRAASGNTIEGLKKLGEQGIAATIKPVSFYGVKVRTADALSCSCRLEAVLTSSRDTVRRETYCWCAVS